MTKRLNLYKVHMPSDVAAQLSETLHSGQIAQGPKNAEFEKRLAEFFGNDNLATTNAGTSALTLALKCAGVGHGDQVISTPMTCVATNTPILNVGADIVWADVDPRTGNISPRDIRNKMSRNIKAIMYVHLGGQPAEIDEIKDIAFEWNVPIIEDAAHAMGAKYEHMLIGNHSDYVCFSFQAIKYLTTGDGGLVLTNGHRARERIEQIRRMRWFGLDRNSYRSSTKWEADIDVAGYKMHMNDIAATIGLCQMNYLSDIIRKHIDNGLYLDEALKQVDGIQMIRRRPYTKASYWFYTLLLNTEKQREKFAKHMDAHGIDTNVSHIRNDIYSIFQKYKTALPNLDDFASRMINIPCGWWLDQGDIEYMVKTIREGWL